MENYTINTIFEKNKSLYEICTFEFILNNIKFYQLTFFWKLNDETIQKFSKLHEFIDNLNYSLNNKSYCKLSLTINNTSFYLYSNTLIISIYDDNHFENYFKVNEDLIKFLKNLYNWFYKNIQLYKKYDFDEKLVDDNGGLKVIKIYKINISDDIIDNLKLPYDIS